MKTLRWHEVTARLDLKEVICTFNNMDKPYFLTRTMLVTHLLDVFDKELSSRPYANQKCPDSFELTKSVLKSVERMYSDLSVWGNIVRCDFENIVNVIIAHLSNLYLKINASYSDFKSIRVDKWSGDYLDIKFIALGKVDENNNNQIGYLS